MSVTLYHNPRCSKSRKTLELLKAQGVEVIVVEYLKEPPDAARLQQLLRILGIPARELLRKRESAYQEAGLDATDLSDEIVIAAMVKHPILIERPIVVNGSQAVIGRPPENALKIV